MKSTGANSYGSLATAELGRTCDWSIASSTCLLLPVLAQGYPTLLKLQLSRRILYVDHTPQNFAVHIPFIHSYRTHYTADELKSFIL